MGFLVAESAGESLGNSGGGAGSRLPSGGERTARIKELELAMNKRMFKHSLAGSSITSATAPGADERRLDMEAKMEVVADSLDRRASLEDLTNQGIFQVTRARVRLWCAMCLLHVKSGWILMHPHVPPGCS